MIKNKLLLLLVLLMTAATGAWATPNSIVINGTPQVGDKSISLTYYFDPANVPGITTYAPTLKVKCAADNKWDEMNLSLTEVSSGTTNISLKNLGEFEAGKTYEVCFAYFNGNWVDEVFQSFVPAAPVTYKVTMKDGVKDAANWTIASGSKSVKGSVADGLTGLEEGDAVTLTYTGRLKVKGVKATSDAAPAAVSLIVNPVVGQIIGSDGKNYDADATLPTGVTAVAKIVYVGSDNGEAAPYNHGLALALSNANDGSSCKWKTSNTDAGHTKQSSSTFTEESGLQYNDATHNSDTYPAFKAAIANNGTAAPTGCSAWFLASGYQWKKMAGAAGLTNLGLTEGAGYWSSSERVDSQAWVFLSGNWYQINKNTGYRVLACLAF